MTKFQSVSMRFLKGFVASGLAAVGTFLSAGVTVTSLDDLKKLVFPLIIAFLTGALLGAEKLINWQDVPQV